MKRITKTLLSVVALLTFVFAMSVVVMAAPSTPTGLVQTDAGKTSIDVQWDPVLGNNITYEVSMSTDGFSWTVVSATRYSSTYYHSGLIAGKSYYVKVRAYDSSSKSYSAYSSAFKVVTAPEQVENVVQTGATTSSFTISWDKVDGATSYIVYKKIDNQDYPLGTTTGTTYTVKDLNNKMPVPFDIYVCPVNSSGTYNAVPSYSTGIYDFNLKLAPSKVQNVHVANYWGSINEINIKFDEAQFNDGYQYQVYNYKGKKISTGTTTSESFHATNIKATTFYKVRVRAYIVVNNKTIYGAWSDYKMFGQQVKPTVKNLKKGVKISWKKVQGAKSYTVYMSTNKDKGYKKIKTLKKTSLTVTKFKKKSIKKYKTYYYYIVATTKQGKKTIKSDVSYWYSFYKY